MTKLSPMEIRVHAAATLLFDALDPVDRETTQALIDLDPDANLAGIRIGHDSNGDVVFAWAGRHLGTVDGEWIRTGQVRP
jgi:hypothetical protein